MSGRRRNDVLRPALFAGITVAGMSLGAALEALLGRTITGGLLLGAAVVAFAWVWVSLRRRYKP